MERKDTIKIVLLNLLVLLGIVLLLQVSQKNTADIYMEYVVSTKSGENLLFFSNFIYENMLSGLYSLLPQVSWYGITQYLFMFISFVVITYHVANRFKGKAGMVITVLLLGTFGYECYYNPEYTKTALLMTVSALLLLLFGAQKKNIVASLFGSVWAILGALVNERVFFLTLILFGAFMALWMLMERQKRTVFALVNVVLVVAIVCVASGADKKQYETFQMENGGNRDAIVTLYDFGWPEYSLHGYEYGILNITEDMYDSMMDGRFVAITWNQITSLANVKIEHRYGMSNVLQKENIFEMFTSSANYVLLAFMIVFLVSTSKQKLIKIASVIMAFAGCTFVTYYFGAEQSDWIMYGIALVLSVALLLGMEELDYEKLRHNLYPVLGIALYFFFLNNSFAHMGTADWKESKEAWVEQRSENVEAQYIFDLRSFVGSKPVFTSYADLTLAENMYITSYLDYINDTDGANAFSLSIMGQYSSYSYWCEEAMNIYSISNSVRLTEGHSVGFVEMSRAESVIIFGVSVQ